MFCEAALGAKNERLGKVAARLQLGKTCRRNRPNPTAAPRRALALFQPTLRRAPRRPVAHSSAQAIPPCPSSPAASWPSAPRSSSTRMHHPFLTSSHLANLPPQGLLRSRALRPTSPCRPRRPATLHLARRVPARRCRRPEPAHLAPRRHRPRDPGRRRAPRRRARAGRRAAAAGALGRVGGGRGGGAAAVEGGPGARRGAGGGGGGAGPEGVRGAGAGLSQGVLGHSGEFGNIMARSWGRMLRSSFGG